MDVKTFRAGSLQEAIAMIRRDLGPDAAVLHTRELNGGVLRWMWGGRRVEVTASNEFDLPVAAPIENQDLDGSEPQPWESSIHQEKQTPSRSAIAPTARLQSLVDELRAGPNAGERSDGLRRQLINELRSGEVEENLAAELADRVMSTADTLDLPAARAVLLNLLTKEIETCGPIEVAPGESLRVALVGPTGVGKTTTIAKLAADFRLQHKLRVGLVTVDTFRIAAVEQLRTYADMLDVPMEVVSTPREMQAAMQRLSNLDLILIDTAGRSPRDETSMEQLNEMLDAAQADEVHLVLSSVSSSKTLLNAADCFAKVGLTSLLITKLDEAYGLGHVLPLLRRCGLPIGYVTDGQNVPNDYQTANSRTLAEQMLQPTM